MSKQQIESLITAATATLAFGDDRNHTVSAAVLTAEGEVFTGLNLYHFTGGPCAELVAVMNAVSAGSKEITGIVAVGNNNRGVLSPCGRCRQILFDYYPDLNVVIKRLDTVVLVPIKDLLPETYDWNKEQENY